MEKQLLCFLLVVSSLSRLFGSTGEASQRQSFGKTHFVVGLPKEQHILKKNSEETQGDQVCCLPFNNSKELVRHAFFSPDDNIKKVLIELINAENKGIKLAAFIVTDKDIAQALIDARQRGVSIEVVTDAHSSKDKFSKITMLADAKISIYNYEAQSSGIINDIMHHKFIVFKENIHHKTLLWTGSFNLTKSANERNHENVLIVEEPCLVERYEKRFDYLKSMIGKAKNSVQVSTVDKHKERLTRFAQTTPRKRYAKARSIGNGIIKNITRLV